MKPLLHIGYHKTGSTWLQKSFFNQSTLGFEVPFERRQLVAELLYPHPFDFNVRQTATIFSSKITGLCEDGAVPVLSCEQFSGAFLTGATDSAEIAMRLQKVFPNALIFIVIREQTSMIASVYSQYIKAGGVLSLKGFIQQKVPFMRRMIGPYFDLAHFRYHRLIEHYFDLFSRNNVLVLPYELFHQSPKAYLSELLNFVDLNPDKMNEVTFSKSHNVSLSPLSLTIKRLINPLVGVRTAINPHVLISRKGINGTIRRTLTKFDSYLPNFYVQKAKAKMRNQVAEIIGENYVESNRKTAQITGLDLAQWGYQL